MPIPLTPAQRQALRGPVAIRTLIDLYLDSGTQSYWDGEGRLIYDGRTYIAAGAFAWISSISLGVDLGAEGMELSLDATRLMSMQPVPGDPAALLGSIEEEPYQQRRMEVRFAFFNASTGQGIMTWRRFAGLIDQMEVRDEPNDQGGRIMLIVRCESIARRYGRRLGRTRTHEDQQEIWPGDDFFKYVASTVASERSLLWGRKEGTIGNAAIVRPQLVARKRPAGARNPWQR